MTAEWIATLKLACIVLVWGGQISDEMVLKTGFLGMFTTMNVIIWEIQCLTLCSFMEAEEKKHRNIL